MKGMSIMKFFSQWLLSKKIEHLWNRADQIKSKMYRNPTLQQFREYALLYRLLIDRARNLQLLYALRAENQ